MKPGCFASLLVAVAAMLFGSCCLLVAEGEALALGGLPKIDPDYSGITLPLNIAPLNFRLREEGSVCRVVLKSRHGDGFQVTSNPKHIRFPAAKWHKLLRSNPGQVLEIMISVKGPRGGWRTFQTLTNHIAPEGIDAFLTYRRLKPLYNVYVNLGIYQRDLESFSEKALLENRNFGGDCLNCHTYLNNNAESFAVNIRTATNMHPMVLVQSNKTARVEKTMGYLSWHPSGTLLAFTANRLSMLAHTSSSGEAREVYDAASDIGIYNVVSNTYWFPPTMASSEWNENWPAFSPDGRMIYFCRARPAEVERIRDIRYDLVRARFNPLGQEFESPETLVSSQESGLSCSQPKPSPDGRYVLFCMSGYGHFPVYQSGSDLYVLELGTGKHRRLAINSSEAESWHGWSKNSRWVVFSSKRIDGLFARPFFSYVDQSGEFHKPFLLPQEDPAFYDTCLDTFNLPELTHNCVTVAEAQLVDAILRPGERRLPKEARPGL